MDAGLKSSLGIQLGYYLGKHFGFGTEIELRNEYLSYQWEYSRMQNSGAPEPALTGQAELDVNALRVPLYAKLRFGQTVSFTLFAGPYMHFLLGYQASGNNRGTPITKETLDDQIGGYLTPNKSKWGITTGVEVRYSIVANQHLMLRGRFGRDHIALTYSSPNGSNWLNLQLGYGFTF